MADQTPAPGSQHGTQPGTPEPQQGPSSGSRPGSPEQPGEESRRTDPRSQLARGELVHAEVKPLDLSGIPTVMVLTAGWAVALVLTLVFRDDLEADGRGWWVWVTVAGLVLGLLGLVYCRRRWAAIQAGHRPAQED